MFQVIVQIKYIAALPIDDPAYAAQTLLEAADGDIWKKIFTITTFCIVLLLAGWRDVCKSVSWPYILTIFWCLISASWAVEPAISIRRSIAMTMLLFTVSACVRGLGTNNTLRVVYTFAALLLISSLISVALSFMPIFSFARHPSNETDASLVGNWRGVMMHKNVAGAMMSYSTIVFLQFALHRKKSKDWLLFIGALGFLVGTKSKTSLALVGIAISAGIIYRLLMSNKYATKNLLVLFSFCILSGLLLGIVDYDRVYAYLSNPGSLSGRIAIWTSLLTYIIWHFILGAGYGSFWAIGPHSPIFAIATKQFILGIGHSHNGYFEVLVTVGFIGLILALTSLVFLPLYRMITLDPHDRKAGALCFSIWFFGVLQNFMESQFFAPDKQSWMFIVISIAIIHNLAMKSIQGNQSIQPVRGEAPRFVLSGSQRPQMIRVEGTEAK
jgi:exopolysaccharide production protein ExoQ